MEKKKGKMMNVDDFIEKEFKGESKKIARAIYDKILYPYLEKVMKLGYMVEAIDQRLPSKIKEVNSLDTIGKGVTLVDFYDEYCYPCFKLLPAMEMVAGEFDGKAEFVKIDVEKNEKAIEKFNIAVLPTVIVFRDGKVVQRLEGCPTDKDKRIKIIRWMVQRAFVPQEFHSDHGCV